VIPIDVDHHRSEATLGFDILTKVVNIVNQKDTETVHNIILWVVPPAGDMVND
jgi:hypothetical protein